MISTGNVGNSGHTCCTPLLKHDTIDAYIARASERWANLEEPRLVDVQWCVAQVRMNPLARWICRDNAKANGGVVANTRP